MIPTVGELDRESQTSENNLVSRDGTGTRVRFFGPGPAIFESSDPPDLQV